jgi:hypothetical protein
MSHRSKGAWTVTVTYLAVGLAHAANSLGKTSARFSVSEPPVLKPVDRMIVDYALGRLQGKLECTTLAFHLLPLNFTLSELRAVYEDVVDRLVDKRNFRRRIHAAGPFEVTGESRGEGSRSPARHCRLRTAPDTETYLTPASSTRSPRKAPKL